MNKRILGFDIARAFAILGMMFVNYKIIFTYGVVKHESIRCFLSIFEGRAAAVFLVLAGIGIGFMTKRSYESESLSERNKDINTIIKRAIFLFIIGLMLFIGFEWTADILHYYGIYMAIIILLLYKSPKKIMIISSLILISSTVMQLVLNYSTNWDSAFMNYYNIFTLKGFLLNSFFNGYHPVFPWIVFMLFGLSLAKLDFRNNKTINKMIIHGLVIALSVELISFIIIKSSNYSELIIYLFDTKPMNPTVLYIIAASAWASVFIGICLKLSDKFNNSKLMDMLASTGQMALTHYVAHSVIVLGVFFAIDKLKYRSELFVLVLSIVVFAFMVIFSNIWSKKYKRGPLELLMRKITG
ncbi:DUF418 domain-containing protein [Clostridiaceae bacterium HSG29]|nr:DUF418 domain-containing protein [Clostridiaceae bacterium HSG29]